MNVATLSRAHAAHLEQRTLKISFLAVLLIAVGSIVYGMLIGSGAVILNGVFSLFSLISTGMSLLAARLVARPEDRRFPFGYAHVEPLVLSVNGFVVLLLCVYALLGGIDSIRAGGREVDPVDVVLFGAVSGVICLTLWAHERGMARKLDSLIIKDDSREWLIDFGYSMVTLLAFAITPLLDEPWRALWGRYADPVMVSVLALIALCFPIHVLRRSLREVLMMAREDDAVMRRVDEVMRQIQSEQDVIRYVSRVVKKGRMYFIEVDVVVGPDFALQTVADQDLLRERIWRAIGKPFDEAWLSIAFTADPRWV